jgi:hypothetical protein
MQFYPRPGRVGAAVTKVIEALLRSDHTGDSIASPAGHEMESRGF